MFPAEKFLVTHPVGLVRQVQFARIMSATNLSEFSTDPAKDFLSLNSQIEIWTGGTSENTVASAIHTDDG